MTDIQDCLAHVPISLAEDVVALGDELLYLAVPAAIGGIAASSI